MAEQTMVGALNMALARAMTDDHDVVLFGEDVGKDGGVFRVTDGLLDRFGPDRVLDTPLSEAAIAGVAVGAAAQGLRAVAEIQFSGFAYPAIDQMVNHAARLRNRTRGRLSCPMVLRMPYGGGIRAPEHHSESPEAMFAHIPGLRVVIPSSPRRAYGLMLAAIRDPDPVVFLEPKRRYRAVREDVPDDGVALPLDRCFIERDGGDVTLVAWGAMLAECHTAAEALAGKGVQAEIIDVATLKPFDADTVCASVEKTGRCVVVQEATLTGGFASEVAATLAERTLAALRAPIERVAGWDTVMPLPRLEALYMPGVARIVAACDRAMSYT